MPAQKRSKVPETTRITSEEGSKERSASGALPRLACRTQYLLSSYPMSISVLFGFKIWISQDGTAIAYVCMGQGLGWTTV